MAGSSGTLLLQQRRASSALRAAVPPLPPLAVVAVVVLLAAAAAAPAAAAPVWLFPPGTTKPPVIEGVQCPSNVVDVPNSAAFPPAPWAASATYRLTTAGAEYVLPDPPRVIAAGVTVCILGTRATLRAAGRMGFAIFDVQGGALGLSGVTLRADVNAETGVSLTGSDKAPGKLGAAQVVFEELGNPLLATGPGATAAFRDARFARSTSTAVRATGAALTFNGQTVFEDNERDLGPCGGLYVLDGGSALFHGPARFSRNKGRNSFGTAVACVNNCTLTFLDDVLIEDSAPADNGEPILAAGTVYVFKGSTATFAGKSTRFVNNTVGEITGALGGGVFVKTGSRVTFASRLTEFVGQRALAGGGVFVNDSSSVEFVRGDVRATGSSATNGGAFLWVQVGSTVKFGPETTLDVNNNRGSFSGQLIAVGDATVDVQSRWARFTNNVAGFGGAVETGIRATLTFGPSTALTMASNYAPGGCGALFTSRNSITTFAGPACFKNNSAAAAGEFGGGALYVEEDSRLVFKDPPSSPASGGGGLGCKLPHPLFCPAGQQGQVMGDNSATYGPAAVVFDSSSAIECASNGLTRGQGAWAIEGPVCGAACVSGGGNCTCPAGQPFSAADCACKGSKPLWPFPHPWLGGKAGASAATATTKTAGATTSSAAAVPRSKAARSPKPVEVITEAVTPASVADMTPERGGKKTASKP